MIYDGIIYWFFRQDSTASNDEPSDFDHECHLYLSYLSQAYIPSDKEK